jgi:hypothetical protein
MAQSNNFGFTICNPFERQTQLFGSGYEEEEKMEK